MATLVASRSVVSISEPIMNPTPATASRRLLTGLPLSLIVCLVLGASPGVPGAARAQTLPAGQAVNPATLTWPRVFTTNGCQFALYQPQIDSWRGENLSGRFAAGVRSLATSNETYGVVFFTARTEVDKVNRLVTLDDFQLTRTVFPTRRGMEQGYLDSLRQRLPQTARIVPLDHLEAVFVVSTEAAKALAVQVKNDTPQILYATEPSILILVAGPPIVQPLAGTYQRVVNTRAVMLTNAADQTDYLYAGGNWYTAPSFAGPWNANPFTPADITNALDAALDTKQVDPMQPSKPLSSPLDIYVSMTPAELIQTAGAVALQPVPGTSLQYVANSDSAIFYCTADTFYYLLLSGRWFKAPYVYGPWQFLPAASLPADFAKIPLDNPKANALASVPGTPQAQEAVIASSIPQTASISRSSASLAVNYQGPPGFTAIGGTSLSYATNTATLVIQVEATDYYACEGGVWFEGASPSGPWAPATAVPRAIYTIPPSCPVYYVTYAYVYGSTPDYVYTGYTPGYAGVCVAPDGVVVYGTGYDYPPVVIGSAWVPYPVTYGFGWGMAINPNTGFAYGFAAGASFDCWCHPYWGCYGWASGYDLGYSRVNLNSANLYAHWGTAVRHVGSWGYNAYTGQEWSAQRTAVFNPYTGAYTGNRQSTVINPYSGSAPVTYRATASAPARSPAAWSSSGVYAGRDGNVYRATPAGGYEQYDANNGWQAARTAMSSWATRETYAQSVGYQRYDSYRSDGGGGWGGRYSRGRR